MTGITRQGRACKQCQRLGRNCGTCKGTLQAAGSQADLDALLDAESAAMGETRRRFGTDMAPQEEVVAQVMLDQGCEPVEAVWVLKNATRAGEGDSERYTESNFQYGERSWRTVQSEQRLIDLSEDYMHARWRGVKFTEIEEAQNRFGGDAGQTSGHAGQAYMSLRSWRSEGHDRVMEYAHALGGIENAATAFDAGVTRHHLAEVAELSENSATWLAASEFVGLVETTGNPDQALEVLRQDDPDRLVLFYHAAYRDSGASHDELIEAHQTFQASGVGSIHAYSIARKYQTPYATAKAFDHGQSVVLAQREVDPIAVATSMAGPTDRTFREALDRWAFDSPTPSVGN